MGSHRADSRAQRGRRSVTRETHPHHPGNRAAPKPAKRTKQATPATTVRAAEKPTAPARRTTSGKRSAPRKSLFRGLPSAPIVLGIAALAVSAGGAVSVADPGLVGAASRPTSAAKIMQASAVTGAGGVASTSVRDRRGPIVSRDSRRDAQGDAAGNDVYAEAEAQAKEREAALADIDAAADKQNGKIRLNLWHLPVASYHLTARFGDYGLWSSYHTGLDFNGNDGDPIKAIANGVVTFVGYDGSYGNKTVVTLEDGTEIWYCHQSAYSVSEGDTVRGGEVIGAVGSTGHVTGSHLHVEVRPGGGDPVDPYAAFVVHGVTP